MGLVSRKSRSKCIKTMYQARQTAALPTCQHRGMPTNFPCPHKFQVCQREIQKQQHKTFKTLNINLHSTQGKKNTDAVQWEHKGEKFQDSLRCWGMCGASLGALEVVSECGGTCFMVFITGSRTTTGVLE